MCIVILLSCTVPTNDTDQEQKQSPDENGYIVYIENNEISVMETSGRKIEVIAPQIKSNYKFGPPKWSPNGTRIAFIKKNDFSSPSEIDIVEFSALDSYYYTPVVLDTASELLSNYELGNRKVTQTLFVNDLLPQELSCNSTNIVFDWVDDHIIGIICQSVGEQSNTGNSIFYYCELNIDSETENLQDQLTCNKFSDPSPDHNIVHLDISPNTPDEFLISNDFQEAFLFSKESGILALDGNYPSWSSDGQKIAYVNPLGSLNVYDVISGEDFVVYDPGKLTKNPLELSTEELTYEWYKNIYPWWGKGLTWSCDDDVIYFSAARFIGTRPFIFSINVKTQEITQLTVDESIYPHYYPRR